MTHGRCRLLITAGAIALLSLAARARAHEIGTTRVRLTLRQDATWYAEMTSAPQSLADKLDAAAGRMRGRALDAMALRRKLESLGPLFARQLEVRFDGVASPSSVRVAQLEVPSNAARPAFVVMRAEGTIPPGAHSVTWRYALAYSTYALVIGSDREATPATQWIEADATSRPFPLSSAIAPPTRFRVIRQYLRLGFLHIVPRGFDHILFVLGIFLLTTKLRPILTQVTAFTIAHSITLGLTMYGIVSLPSRVVEPLIAVSIAYVAIENVLTTELKPWRAAVVFGFGLLHGMGFAGVLKDLGLPRSEFIPALVSFNCGVELAQLSVIAAAFLSIAAWHRQKAWYRAGIVVPASLLIAATGVFWTVERLLNTR